MANRGRHRKKIKIRIPINIPISLQHLSKPILTRMMECQIEQGNKADLTVFLHNILATKCAGGFDWGKTIEGYAIWYSRLLDRLSI